jgi:anti-sigma B factor antagonist
MATVTFSEQPIDDETHVLELEGELDISNTFELRRLVNAALSAGRTRLVLDLSALRHADSSGLAELLAARSAVDEAEGGRLAIAVGKGPLRRMFEVRGVESLFVLATTRDEAVAAVRDGEF